MTKKLSLKKMVAGSILIMFCFSMFIGLYSVSLVGADISYSLINNGGFETNNLNYWTKSSGGHFTTQETYVRTGTYAGGGNVAWSAGEYLYQQFITNTSSENLAEVSIYSEFSGDVGQKLVLLYTDGTNSSVAIDTGGAGWTQTSITPTGGKIAYGIEIYIATGGATWVILDDVTVTTSVGQDIPSPKEGIITLSNASQRCFVSVVTQSGINTITGPNWDMANSTGGGFIFGTNNSGSWVNNTWTAYTGTRNSSSAIITNNAVVGTVVSYQFWANSSTNYWNSTSIFQFEIIPSYVDIEPALF